MTEPASTPENNDKPDPATLAKWKQYPAILAKWEQYVACTARKPAYKSYKPPATPSTPATAKRVPFVKLPSHPIALALIFVAEEARRSPYDKDKKIFLTTKNKFLQEKALFLRQGLMEPQPYNILVSSELDFDAVDEAVQAGFNGAITQKQIELLDSAAAVINRQTPQNTPLTSDGAPEAPAAVQAAPAPRCPQGTIPAMHETLLSEVKASKGHKFQTGNMKHRNHAWLNAMVECGFLLKEGKGRSTTYQEASFFNEQQ